MTARGGGNPSTGVITASTAPAVPSGPAPAGPGQQTLPPPAVVTGPGVYSIPVEEYHARPELSSTGARKLLPPSCPALFKHWRDEGEEPKRAWDIGHGAHNLVLGAGPELVRIGAEEWRSNAVKADVKAARDEGKVPLRPSEWDTVHAMAEALRAHPFAGKLFEPGSGTPEQTLIWDDGPSGVMCRALLDWLPHPTPGRFLLTDFKSGRSAAPDKLGRTISDFGYHVQLRFYLAGAQALGLAGEDAEALLVFQETRPPYLVTVSQPDQAAMRIAAIRVREALDLYADCTATDHWPGYSDDVVLTELPPWETRELNGEVW